MEIGKMNFIERYLSRLTNKDRTTKTFRLDDKQIIRDD